MAELQAVSRHLSWLMLPLFVGYVCLFEVVDGVFCGLDDGKVLPHLLPQGLKMVTE